MTSKPLPFMISLVAFALCIGPVHAEMSFSLPIRIETELGFLEGDFDTQKNLKTFFGVPFAQPPVGDLRWKAPQPLEPWDGVRPAHDFGPRPVQAPLFGDMRFRSPGLSEDCLYLNIWAPAANEQPLPVLVYFYGGGLLAGDSSEKRYDGAHLASKGMIVVTVNYRLNVFGLLAHPELSAESSYGGSGNYAFLDQAAAIRWVRDHIRSFGGDPAKITIGGESAGSRSVCYQMASPLARDLIAGGIGESGSALSVRQDAAPLAEAEAIGTAFMEHAGVKNLAELRALSTYEIYQAYATFEQRRMPPTVDHYFLPRTAKAIFASGEQAQVPLLLGWNTMESGFWRYFGAEAPTAESVKAKIRELYPEDAAEVFGLYPFSKDQESPSRDHGSRLRYLRRLHHVEMVRPSPREFRRPDLPLSLWQNSPSSNQRPSARGTSGRRRGARPRDRLCLRHSAVE